VLTAQAATRWLSQDVSGEEAEDIARQDSVPAEARCQPRGWKCQKPGR